VQSDAVLLGGGTCAGEGDGLPCGGVGSGEGVGRAGVGDGVGSGEGGGRDGVGDGVGSGGGEGRARVGDGAGVTSGDGATTGVALATGTQTPHVLSHKPLRLSQSSLCEAGAWLRDVHL
jgi:hypothetical protein